MNVSQLPHGFSGAGDGRCPWGLSIHLGTHGDKAKYCVLSGVEETQRNNSGGRSEFRRLFVEFELSPRQQTTAAKKEY